MRVLTLHPSGRVLTLQLGQRVAKACMPHKGDKFAIIKNDAIASAKTVHDILFLTRAIMRERMDHPAWDIPAPGGPRTPLDWRSRAKPWLAAAERSSKLLGHGYLIVPRTDPFTGRVVAVRVGMTHDGTAWTSGMLYTADAEARPYAVVAGRRHCLTLADVEARRRWTYVDLR